MTPVINPVIHRGSLLGGALSLKGLRAVICGGGPWVVGMCRPIAIGQPGA